MATSFTHDCHRQAISHKLQKPGTVHTVQHCQFICDPIYIYVNVY